MEGFAFDSLRIPERIFETPSPVDSLNERCLKGALAYAREIVVKGRPACA